MTAADGWCDEMSLNRFVSPPNDVQMETPYGLSPPQFIMPPKMRHCAKVDVRQGKGPTIIQKYAVEVAQQYCENFFRLSCKLLYKIVLPPPIPGWWWTANLQLPFLRIAYFIWWDGKSLQTQLLLASKRTARFPSLVSITKKFKIDTMQVFLNTLGIGPYCRPFPMFT